MFGKISGPNPGKKSRPNLGKHRSYIIWQKILIQDWAKLFLATLTRFNVPMLPPNIGTFSSRPVHCPNAKEYIVPFLTGYSLTVKTYITPKASLGMMGA